MSSQMDGIDIPQSNRLDRVRDVIHVISEGTLGTHEIHSKTGIKTRHILYAVHSARILNLLTIEEHGFALTELGRDLISTARNSQAETELLRYAICNSRILHYIAPGLLESVIPSVQQMTDRIMRLSSLSHSTVKRRVGTLMAWRHRLMTGQGELFSTNNDQLILTIPSPRTQSNPSRSVQQSSDPEKERTSMKINSDPISASQRDLIINAEESHFLDLKAIDIKPAKLTKTISAFANASGGELYIGIDENTVGDRKIRAWRGFPNQETANAHLQVFEQLFPLGQYYSYSFLSAEGCSGLVLHVNINKTREITRASDRVPYIRRSAQGLPVDTEEGLTRLKLDKGIESFEKSTLDVPLSLITNSTHIIQFLLNVVPSAEPAQWLEKQLLIRDGKPTVAGVLLFAEEPQAILPKRCAVKIYRYRSSTGEGARETLAFDPLTIEGCLYNQIYESVKKAVELTEGIQKLGPKGLVGIKYPFETLHEIVTNAVLHRDYSIASDIHLRIFDNRIEVESPGRLPGHITRNNILTEQFARNGAIVRMINKFPNPPNKDVGEGLNTAFLAMNRLRLKAPIIDETATSVVVHIRHEALASPEESILEYLQNHEEIVNRIGRQITGITSENSMKEVFYRMRDRGMIERIPGREGPAAAWRKSSQ